MPVLGTTEPTEPRALYAILCAMAQTQRRFQAVRPAIHAQHSQSRARAGSRPAIVVVALAALVMIALACSPPATSHSVEGRENCVVCHAIDGTSPFPAWHADRTNAECADCHQQSVGRGSPAVLYLGVAWPVWIEPRETALPYLSSHRALLSQAQQEQAQWSLLLSKLPR